MSPDSEKLTLQAMQSCLQIIPENTRRVIVAFSGGLDSSVLLDLVVRMEKRCDILPWHFNHGLIAEADAMEAFCRERSRDYGLELRVDRLRLGDLDSNIEARARQARYQILEQHVIEGDCVLTAHHANDQAETFLLNALRASGSAGLRGIARQRNFDAAVLLRPLLDFSREQLESYARRYSLVWFDDPSNASDRFDRNYLRQHVVPAIQSRWPHFHDALATAARLQAESFDLLEQLAVEDFEQCRDAASAGGATLRLQAVKQLSPARRGNLLRYWISQSGQVPLPQSRLQELQRQLDAKADAQPEISMPGYSVRIYDRRLFLVPAREMPQIDSEYEFGNAAEIRIDAIGLQSSRSAVFEALNLADTRQLLCLRFRVEGRHNRDRQRLKRLFQAQRVPPWERDRVPQVYLDGELQGILR